VPWSRRGRCVLKKQIVVLVGLSLALVGACGAFTVKGKIVDGETGKPAAGMTIRIEHHENRHADQPDDFVRRTKTNKKGEFRIELASQQKDYMFIVMDAAGRIHDGYTHVDEDTDTGTLTLKRDG